MSYVFGMLMRKHSVGIAHCNTQIALCGTHLGDGIRPTVRVNVKEHAANTGGVGYDAACDWSRKMNLTAADDVDDGGGVHVVSVIVAMLKDVKELVLKVSQFLRPHNFGSFSVVLVLEGREASL